MARSNNPTPITVVRTGDARDGWSVPVRPSEAGAHPAVRSSAFSVFAGLAGYAGTMALGMMMLGVLGAVI